MSNNSRKEIGAIVKMRCPTKRERKNYIKHYIKNNCNLQTIKEAKKEAKEDPGGFGIIVGIQPSTSEYEKEVLFKVLWQQIPEFVRILYSCGNRLDVDVRRCRQLKNPGQISVVRASNLRLIKIKDIV